MSAATHEGFDTLIDETAKMLDTLPPVKHFEAEAEEENPVPDGSFEIIMDGPVYVVTGPGMERLIDSVNFDDLDSVKWFHRTLRKLGIIDALREKGAGEGSDVRIADMEFDFIE